MLFMIPSQETAKNLLKLENKETEEAHSFSATLGRPSKNNQNEVPGSAESESATKQNQNQVVLLLFSSGKSSCKQYSVLWMYYWMLLWDNINKN